MRTLSVEKIGDAVYRLARSANFSLTDSCRAALEKAAKCEEGAARFALECALENEKIAKCGLPVCQDTGAACVLLTVGREVFLEGDLYRAIDDGVRRAYEKDLRKSICDPLTRKNTGDNTPAFVHLEQGAGDRVEICFLPKGFGSENMSKIFMLTPAEGRAGIIGAIVEAVREAGSRPCPPVFVGVGIGGTFDSCAYLAKKALTREVGSKNPRADVSSIEEEALEKINALGIGPQGFGGNITALGVACEVAPTHIAGLPVAVNMQCHCVRCAREIL